MSRLIVETTNTNGMPLLTVCPADAAHCPVVVFCHGMGGDKSQGVELGYRLARRGIFFVAPDAPGHGDRADDRMARAEAGLTYPPDTGLDGWLLMLHVAVELAAEVESLLAGWQNDRRVDVLRVGVTGLSLGGYWAHFMAAHNPRVSVAAPAIGLPAWAARWADVTLEAASYPRWAEAMTAAETATAERLRRIEELDPLVHLRRFAPKPLLMLCGDEDLAQPKSYSVKAYRELLPLYADHPDRLRLSINDGVGHRFNSAMQEEATGWFAGWL